MQPRSRQMHATVVICKDDDRGQYLRDCAQLRDVSMTRLAQMLIDKITADKLAEAVLDDAGQHQRRKYERHHRHRALLED